MASEWPRVAVAEVCELIVDCVNKTAPTVEGPTPYKMIRTPNVKAGRVSTDDCRYVDEEAFLKWTRRASVQKDDVLLTREAPLGEVGIVNTDENIFLGQRLMQYRANPEYLDAHFLVYSFLSPDLQHQFHMHEGAGSVVSHIRVGDCSKFELSLPPLYEQKRISGILRALDDKIQLNRQTNQTLEAMAQALFKSWFVDFDPVIDNALAAGHEIPEPLLARAEQRKAFLTGNPSDDTLPDSIRQLFPNRFVLNTEMGWIPEGWQFIPFGKVAQCFDKHRIPLSKKQREEKQPGNIPYYGATSINDYINEWVFDDIFLLIGEDGSVIKEDGSPFVQYIWGKAWVNNHAHVLQGINGVSTEHLMLFMQAQNITAYVTGAVQMKINQKNMNSIPFLNAGDKINRCFADLITPFYEKYRSYSETNGSLTKLRDTLLPKLISGELRLPDSTTAEPQPHSETVAA